MKIIHNAWQTAQDLLYPKQCFVCKIYLRDEQNTSLCATCQKTFTLNHLACETTQHDLDAMITLFRYQGTIRKLVYQFKINGELYVLPYILKKMDKVMAEQNISQWNIKAIVPIPSHKKTTLFQKQSASHVLAQEMCKHMQLPHCNLLRRSRNTAKQSSLPRSLRATNPVSTLMLAPYLRKKTPEAVLLVDDVITSGSTMFEAARVLKQHGVQRVVGFAIARGFFK